MPKISRPPAVSRTKTAMATQSKINLPPSVFQEIDGMPYLTLGTHSEDKLGIKKSLGASGITPPRSKMFLTVEELICSK